MTKLSPAEWPIAFEARKEWASLRNAGAARYKRKKPIIRLYKALGLSAPAVYEFQSPLAAMLAIPHLAAFHNLPTYHQYLLNKLQEPLTTPLGLPNRNGWLLNEQVSRPFGRPLNVQLTPKFVDSYTDTMGELLRKLGGEKFFEARQGTFFQPILHETLDWWNTVVLSDCWWFPYSKFLVISSLPTICTFDAAGRLHGEKGPAIQFDDDCVVWSWQGVPVPEKAYLSPELISADEVDKEDNAEVRRVMIERMGAGRYLRETGAKLLDMDSLTLEGSAPRALVMDKHGNKWLIGTDGSTARVYTMAVPREVDSCEEAHRRISGFDEQRLIAEA